MTEKLKKLISLAITDGVITDKEREILLKKAIEEGLDLDEFEMEFEAKLFERQQELKKQTASQITKPKSNKEGVLKKCPSCGSPVESFNTKCADCGHEFRNTKASNNFSELMDKLNNLKKPKDKYGYDDEGQYDIKYASIITNHPIPNTKEDILDFLTHAFPEANKKVSWLDRLESSWGPALFKKTWHSKCQQIIMKARFSMKEDKKTLSEIEYYAKELKIK